MNDNNIICKFLTLHPRTKGGNNRKHIFRLGTSYTSRQSTTRNKTLFIAQLDPLGNLVGLKLGAVKIERLALAGLAAVLLSGTALDLGVRLLTFEKIRSEGSTKTKTRCTYTVS
jgi:hypothetical protein